MDSPILLQASRRLDWQFLLPQPDLDRVAYFGPADSNLVRSLELFSNSLTCLENSAESQQRVGQYDLLVMSDPTAGDIRKWTGLVRPGGSLYIETYGWFGLGRRKGAGSRSMTGLGPMLKSPRNLIAFLGKIGFTVLETNWHWPDFETCTRIISLKEESGLLYLFSKGQQAQGVGAALARRLVRSGLLVQLVPCLSILACWPE